MDTNSRRRLTIFATFAVALLLTSLPGPDWLEPFRPDWVALVLIYWCLAAPERAGVGAGWMAGLMLDVLYGSLLGQHAAAKALIAYLTLKLHLRIRVFPVWQQAATVLVLLLINQLLVLWIRVIADHSPATFAYWLSSIVGMLIWPWLFLVLRNIRRRANIS